MSSGAKLGKPGFRKGCHTLHELLHSSSPHDVSHLYLFRRLARRNEPSSRSHLHCEERLKMDVRTSSEEPIAVEQLVSIDSNKMTPTRSFCAFALSSLIVSTSARIALRPHHRHEAVAVGKRQHGPPIMVPPPGASSSMTAVPGVLTYITPSPGATPVAVTKESQIVTSYLPQFTLCELPPIEFFSVSPPPVSASLSTAPYKNYSVSIPPGNGTCTTIYSPTPTMVCATTLTALADKYTVTNCNQEITFSTQYGYVLATLTSTTPTSTPSILAISSGTVDSNVTVSFTGIAGPSSHPSATRSASMAVSNSSSTSGPSTGSSVSSSTDIGSILGATSSVAASSTNGLVPRQASDAPSTITPAPSIETLTTYYLAPWQQLTAGTAPSEVDLKVFQTFTNGSVECIREYQVWSTSLVTLTTTSVTSINISTTIHGTSQVLVETFVANVTELLTTFSLSTTMDLEFQTEFTTTHRAPRTLSTSTGPTVFETLTVEQASKTSSYALPP